MNFSKSLFAIFIVSLVWLISSFNLVAQEKDSTEIEKALTGFKFRSIGPAFMSGRIADIAIDPSNLNTWYVAVGSGGVWKTSNAGTTWTPLTDIHGRTSSSVSQNVSHTILG